MCISFDYNHYFELITSGDIETAITYRASFTPDYIYKFFWLTDNTDNEENQKRFKTLRDNCLWFATPVNQNDPYEFKGVYFDEHKLLELGIPSEAIIKIKNELLNKCALSAFTTNMYNNLPMWAHYANNHHGYCVKYEVQKKECFRNIIYGEHRVPMTNTFFDFLNHASDSEKSHDFGGLKEILIASTLMQDIFFFKHYSWEYEKEFRALHFLSDYVSGENVHIEKIGLKTAEIYSGINCSSKNKQVLSEIASYLGVPFKECIISDDDFTVLDG